MRTTVRLPDQLLAAAKRRAQATGRSLTQLLEDCLRNELRQAVRGQQSVRPLPTFGGKGLRPGVDLSDASALEDLMSGR